MTFEDFMAARLHEHPESGAPVLGGRDIKPGDTVEVTWEWLKSFWTIAQKAIDPIQHCVGCGVKMATQETGLTFPKVDNCVRCGGQHTEIRFAPLGRDGTHVAVCPSTNKLIRAKLQTREPAPVPVQTQGLGT